MLHSDHRATRPGTNTRVAGVPGEDGVIWVAIQPGGVVEGIDLEPRREGKSGSGDSEAYNTKRAS